MTPMTKGLLIAGGIIAFISLMIMIAVGAEHEAHRAHDAISKCRAAHGEAVTVYDSSRDQLYLSECRFR